MTIEEVPPERVLSQLNGATIKGHYIEDDNGLHFVMQDGRTLVICAAGNALIVCVVPQDSKELH